MSKLRKAWIVFFMMGWVMTSTSFAQVGGEALTWQDCVQETLAHHPQLISAKAQWNQAKASRAITRSVLLPQISSSASASTSKESHDFRRDAYGYALTGQQLLFDGFKANHDLAAAQKDIEASQYAYQVTSSDVRLNLRVAFVELLNAQELLKVTQEIAKRRQQNLELITLLYQGGREHKGSLLTAQADFASAKLEVDQANRGLELAQRRLSKELGREHFFPMTVQGALEAEKIATHHPDFENLAQANPFLQELISQKDAARLGVKSAQADFFPKIYVNAGVGKTDTSWPPQQADWSTGLSLSFPIFEGGHQQAQVAKAKAQMTQAQADERSGRDTVILTLAETWTQWQDAAGHVDVQQKFLQAAQERAKIAQAEYANGMVSFNDWIVIEDNLVNAKKAMLQAQAQTLTAEANWVQAQGGLLDE